MNFNETIKRFFANSASEDDLKNLFLRLNSKKGHDEINQSLNKNWNSFKAESNIYIDSEKILRNIRNGIRRKKSLELKQNFTRLLPYAAMLVMLLGFTFYFFSYKKNVHTPEELVVNNRVTSVITQNGQRSKVVLPDSSIVWLNSGTTLSYRDNFSENKREVMLDGQAFFQVARNENSPFTVQSKNIVVSVLGTTFDVNAYPETGKVSVVLESGKVELLHREIASFNYSMEPGELAAYNLADNTMHISTTDVAKYSSWKEGLLIFRNEPIKTVFEKLERWYNVDIEVADEKVYESIFTGTIQNESYEQIFRLIKFSCPVKCSINHNSDSELIPKIIITKK
jgi:ferric-dicitrate binding protein FerR (iron transport regulator)